MFHFRGYDALAYIGTVLVLLGRSLDNYLLYQKLLESFCQELSSHHVALQLCVVGVVKDFSRVEILVLGVVWFLMLGLRRYRWFMCGGLYEYEPFRPHVSRRDAL